jgi:outer membrane protein assembly factor BamB
VNVTAAWEDAASATVTLAQGDEYRLSLRVQWTAAGSAVPSVFLQVRDSRASFEPPAARSVTGSWDFELPLRSTLPSGIYDGQVEIRACKDSACSEVHAGAAATLPYAITLKPVDEWTTHQGSNDHRASRPIRLDPARFREVWRWQRPASGEPVGGINAVASMGGKVFVTTDVYFGEAVIYALDEADGQTAWTRSLGTMPAFGPPAVSADRVFVASAGHSDSFLWGVDLQTGTLRSKSAFESQWPNLLSPTLVNDTAIIGAGYYGGEIYAYSMANGDPIWTRSLGGAWDMFSVAADEQLLYHYDGSALIALRRDTGAVLARVEDPLGKVDPYSYHGGPVLGTQGLVFAYAGGAFSGRASSSSEPYGTRVLSAFDPVSQRVAWHSGHSYRTVPAVANGVIYVGNDMSLDALDEGTGRVLWRFIADPVADGKSFHRNALVTRTHLFVSTDQRVLAIDLNTHAVVWRYPKPGMLALSAGRTLYINVGATDSTGELIAVRLR